DVREVLVEPVLVRVHEEVVDSPQRVVEGIGGILPAHLRGEDGRGRDPQLPVEEAGTWVPSGRASRGGEVPPEDRPEVWDLAVRPREPDDVVAPGLLLDEPLDARALERLDHRDDGDGEQDEGEHREGHPGPERTLRRV